MTMELGRDKTALIVVDMQNSYCRAGGRMEKLGFPYERLAAAEPGCKDMIAAARQAGVPVIYTQYVYQPDFKDGGFVVNEIMAVTHLCTVTPLRSVGRSTDAVVPAVEVHRHQRVVHKHGCSV